MRMKYWSGEEVGWWRCSSRCKEALTSRTPLPQRIMEPPYVGCYIAQQKPLLEGILSASFRLIAVSLAALMPLVASAKLNIVATTPDLASIAKEIGGDNIELSTLAKPTEDPHFVDAKPSFIVKLNRADVLVEGGA